MNVIYTGNYKPTAEQAKKLNGKFAKLAKLVEKKGQREAHVVLRAVRHLQHADITMHFHDHALVGKGANADAFTAVLEAIDKLEGQAKKHSAKWRDAKRTGGGKAKTIAPAPAPVARAAAPAAPPTAKKNARVVRVNHHDRKKPMTLAEAVLEMEKGSNYVAYRDAESNSVSVLVRRADGGFDLIES